ncbi:hypothetical protein GCM10010980_24160 [Corynebacterium marinum]|nr:hypothetical protein GCM10010980_24160 [Corynebacterium marinum]
MVWVIDMVQVIVDCVPVSLLALGESRGLLILTLALRKAQGEFSG